MWGPTGPIGGEGNRPVDAWGKCRCSCYCKSPATTEYVHGVNTWAVCKDCKTDLEGALVPWLP